MKFFNSCFPKETKFPLSTDFSKLPIYEDETQCVQFANSLVRHFYFWSNGELNLFKADFNSDQKKNHRLYHACIFFISKLHYTWFENIKEKTCQNEFEKYNIFFKIDPTDNKEIPLPQNLQEFVKNVGNKKQFLSKTIYPYRPTQKNRDFADYLIKTWPGLCTKDFEKNYPNFYNECYMGRNDFKDKLLSSTQNSILSQYFWNSQNINGFNTKQVSIPRMNNINFINALRRFVFLCYPKKYVNCFRP